jgi:hypothetical protein
LRVADGRQTEVEGRLRAVGPWVVPSAVLLAIWVWLAFSSGGYSARLWLRGSLALGLLGLLVSLLVLYPRRPRQLSWVVLVFFAGYAAWVGCSTIWALSSNKAWLESAQTLSYLLFFSLALVFLTDRGVRVAFRYLLLTASLVIVVLAVIGIWSANDLTSLFLDNRFIYPISYPNGAAALYLITFWPLLWLAIDPKGRAPVRGLALGVCTALLGLAFLTQSRGAFWSLGITVLITFIVSPARLKTLLYLLVPSVLMVWAVPRLSQYWSVGPAGLSGGSAGRTVLVILVTAAFIGMILALLERWVEVSKRMRVVFGALALVAVVAALTYGSVTLTRDVGGPIQWIDKAYHQFTGDESYPSSADAESTKSLDSRLLMISSSGRVNLWRVAWLDFKKGPAIGIGAASFVFTYDQLGERASTRVLQPHSWELQILSETGVVGAVFGFGGVLLVLGGLLWPRCAASWRSARETWLRRRRQDAAEADPTSSGRTSRWGNDPRAYGWEMALLVGVLYFIIHGSLEWLWQIAGVTLAALLLVAAGLSEVDARVGVIWPRLRAWTSLGRSAESGPQTAPAPEAQVDPPSPADDARSDAQTTFLTEDRRTAHYAARRRRRARRERRRRRLTEALIPPGPLSHSFRILLGVLSLLVLVGGGLPYLSLNLQDAALGSTSSNPAGAVARADLAARLDPTDAGPFQVRAYVYRRAAQAAAASTDADRTGAVLDNLALALADQEEGIQREPADWNQRQNAGVATLNLLLATDAISGRTVARPDSAIYGLEDWSALAPAAGSPSGTLAAPGQAAGSLATTTEKVDTAARYRALSREELLARADTYLGDADARYPFSRQVDAALSFLGSLATQ